MTIFLPLLAAILMLLGALWQYGTAIDDSVLSDRKRSSGLLLIGLAIFNWIGYNHAVDDYYRTKQLKVVTEKLEKIDKNVQEMHDSYTRINNLLKGDISGAKEDSNKVRKAEGLREEYK